MFATNAVRQSAAAYDLRLSEVELPGDGDWRTRLELRVIIDGRPAAR
ncbi:hypothetical protein [Actinoplanes sp. NPDC049265]